MKANCSAPQPLAQVRGGLLPCWYSWILARSHLSTHLGRILLLGLPNLPLLPLFGLEREGQLYRIHFSFLLLHTATDRTLTI